MINKTYDKKCDVGKLQSEIIATGYPVYPNAGARFYGCNCDQQTDNSWVTTVMCYDDISAGEVVTIADIVANHIPTPVVVVPTPIDDEGKPYVRAEPRPLNTTTLFTGSGDILDPAEIGAGAKIIWDARIDGEFTTVGAPDGFKQKTIDLFFCDEVYVRAGYIFSNCEYDDYLDLYTMCPPTGYYSDGTNYLQNNTGDYIAIDHNVVRCPLNLGSSGLCLDSGTSSRAIPVGYPIRAVITMPVADVTCFGSAMLMIYRARTVVL